MGDFPDVFDVVAYGKEGTYSITNDRIANTYVMENCPGFSEGSYDGYVHDYVNNTQACDNLPDSCSTCKGKTAQDCSSCIEANCATTQDFIDDCTNSTYGCEIQASRRQTGLSDGSTSASKVLFGAASHTDSSGKLYLLCRRKKYTDAGNLLVLDGNDFFDVRCSPFLNLLFLLVHMHSSPSSSQIAYDRFRCFDKPKLDCSFAYLQLVWVTLGWLGGYALFQLVFRFAKLYGEEECIEITSTLEEQLREAGLTQTAAAVGALVLEEELSEMGM